MEKGQFAENKIILAPNLFAHNGLQKIMVVFLKKGFDNASFIIIMRVVRLNINYSQ